MKPETARALKALLTTLCVFTSEYVSRAIINVLKSDLFQQKYPHSKSLKNGNKLWG